MKRIIAAVLLIVIIAASCIANTKYIDKTYNELSKDISDLIEAYDLSPEKAEKNAEKLKEKWDDKELLLSIFANHEIVENIGLSFSKLPIFAKEKSSDMFLAECKSIELELSHMLKDTKIDAHSLF